MMIFRPPPSSPPKAASPLGGVPLTMNPLAASATSAADIAGFAQLLATGEANLAELQGRALGFSEAGPFGWKSAMVWRLPAEAPPLDASGTVDADIPHPDLAEAEAAHAALPPGLDHPSVRSPTAPDEARASSASRAVDIASATGSAELLAAPPRRPIPTRSSEVQASQSQAKAPPQRTSATVQIQDADGKIQVVAMAAQLTPGEVLKLRAATASAVAEYGYGLSAIVINGEDGGRDFRSIGASHANRTR